MVIKQLSLDCVIYRAICVRICKQHIPFAEALSCFTCVKYFFQILFLFGDGGKTIGIWRRKGVEISYVFRIHLLIKVFIPS